MILWIGEQLAWGFFLLFIGILVLLLLSDIWFRLIYDYKRVFPKRHARIISFYNSKYGDEINKNLVQYHPTDIIRLIKNYLEKKPTLIVPSSYRLYDSPYVPNVLETWREFIIPKYVYKWHMLCEGNQSCTEIAHEEISPFFVSFFFALVYPKVRTKQTLPYFSDARYLNEYCTYDISRQFKQNNPHKQQQEEEAKVIIYPLPLMVSHRLLSEDRIDKYFFFYSNIDYSYRLYHIVEPSPQSVSLPFGIRLHPHGWCNFMLCNMPDNRFSITMQRTKIDHRVVRTKDLFDAVNNGGNMASVSFYLSLPVTVRVDDVSIIDNQIWYLFGEKYQEDKECAEDMIWRKKCKMYVKCSSLLSLSAMSGSDEEKKDRPQHQEIMTPLDAYCEDCFVSLPYNWCIYSVAERAFVLKCEHLFHWVRNPVISHKEIVHLEVSSFPIFIPDMLNGMNCDNLIHEI